MTRRRLYVTCLGSYLTGWAIAQAIYNRVRKHIWRERGMDPDYKTHMTEVAQVLADELESRRDPLDRAPADTTTTVLADLLTSYGGVDLYLTRKSQMVVRISPHGGDPINGYGLSVAEALTRAALAVEEEGMAVG